MKLVALSTGHASSTVAQGINVVRDGCEGPDPPATQEGATRFVKPERMRRSPEGGKAFHTTKQHATTSLTVICRCIDGAEVRLQEQC